MSVYIIKDFMTKNKMHALFLQMQEQAQTPTPQCDEKNKNRCARAGWHCNLQ